jgi:hypothetical protein
MDPQRHRESIMLRINELAEKLVDKDGNLPVEVEKEVDLIDRRLCVALGIDFETAPSAYAYD